jgi:hypothetical protein
MRATELKVHFGEAGPFTTLTCLNFRSGVLFSFVNSKLFCQNGGI